MTMVTEARWSCRFDSPAAAKETRIVAMVLATITGQPVGAVVHDAVIAHAVARLGAEMVEEIVNEAALVHQDAPLSPSVRCRSSSQC